MNKCTWKEFVEDSERRGVPASTIRSWKRRGIPAIVQIDFALDNDIDIRDVAKMNAEMVRGEE